MLMIVSIVSFIMLFVSVCLFAWSLSFICYVPRDVIKWPYVWKYFTITIFYQLLVFSRVEVSIKIGGMAAGLFASICWIFNYCVWFLSGVICIKWLYVWKDLLLLSFTICLSCQEWTLKLVVWLLVCLFLSVGFSTTVYVSYLELAALNDCMSGKILLLIFFTRYLSC